MNNSPKSPFFVLFVDDEDNARKYFEKGLKYSFNILTAPSVEEAQKIIEEKHQEIAVVITDQRMPGGNGVKLLKFLKDKYPHIIRLLTTAYSDLSEAIEAVNAGEILRYIQKPWDFGMLEHEIKQAIELFELRFERNQLLYEKIMVKRKMTKVERVRALVLFAHNLDFLKNSQLSAQKFIKQFIAAPLHINPNQNWQSFDLGNNEILETKFLFNFLDKIKADLPRLEDYNTLQNHDANALITLINQEKSRFNLVIETKSTEQFEAKVSNIILNIFIKKLIQIASLTSIPSQIFLEQIAGGYSIKLQSSQVLLPDSENIFTITPEKNPSPLYESLFTIYLLLGHCGGEVDFTYDKNDLTVAIKLFDIPGNGDLNSKSLLDDVLLTAMIS